MSTEAPLTFGELLRRCRLAAGLTQETLAERARLSPRTISDLERGVTNWPYRDTVELLVEALNLTAEERAALELARRRPPTPATIHAHGDAELAGAVSADQPSHLRTFLIAEIRTYTRFTHERGDAAAAQLAARFAALIRESIAAQGGQVVELRADEMAAAFGSARQALRAALDLRDRCAQATAADPFWPLPVSIGLDAGEAIAVEGGYRGGALSLAAQLCSLAAPGEVLASTGVTHLARKTEGLSYSERGEIALEGLDDPVRVVQVHPEGIAPSAAPRIAGVERADGEASRVIALYRAAQGAMAVEHWDEALECLKALLTLEPDHAEAAALARRVRQHQELPELYSKGREHYDAGRWRAALDYLRQVQEIGGNYRGVFALMATAQYEIARARAQESREPAVTPMPPPAEQRANPLDAHYKQVVKALVDGRVVPFLGMDVNLCGRPAELPWQHGQYPPSNAELASYLAGIFDYQQGDAAELVRVSQHVAIMNGTRPLYTALRDLYDTDYPPTPVHQFLASLPGILRSRDASPHYQLIVTTGYDDVLERAFKTVGEPFDLVSYVAEGEHRGAFMHYPPDGTARLIDRPNEYRGLSPEQRTVILKMHGAVNRADADRDSYVITEDNYINYLTRLDISNLIPVTLLARLRTSHLLFLGYGLRNWSQRVIIHRLWGEQKLSDNYRSWALQVGLQPIDQEFWSKRDVTILPVRMEEYVAALSERVQALARAGTGV